MVKLREAAGKVERVINESGILDAIEKLRIVVAKEDMQVDEIVEGVTKCLGIGKEMAGVIEDELEIYHPYQICYIEENKLKMSRRGYLCYDLGDKVWKILNIFKEYLQMFQESYIASKEFKDTISRQLINLTIYLTLLEDIKFPPSEGLLEKAENMKENQVRPEKTYKFLAYYYLRTQASANRALQGAGNSRDDL